MVERQVVRGDPVDPVDLEQEPPDVAGRGPIDAEGLEDANRLLPIGRARALLDDPIQRVPDRATVSFEQCADERASATPPIRGVVEPAHLPPGGRAHHHARTLPPDPVIEAWEDAQSLVVRDEAHGAVARQLRPDRDRLASGVDAETDGRQAVAVAAVDGLLRRPERGDRLLPLAHVVELGLHHPAEQAPAAMRREHAHPRDSRARQGASRNGHREREDGGRGDDRAPSKTACIRSSGRIRKFRSASSEVGVQPK